MAVKITHEPADIRPQLWVRTPLRVVLDGVEQRASEWSVAGVVIDNPQTGGAAAGGGAAGRGAVAGLTLGQRVAMHLDLPFNGVDVAGEVEDWNPATRRALIGFRDLGPHEEELLAHFVRYLTHAGDAGEGQPEKRGRSTLPGGSGQEGRAGAASELVSSGPAASVADSQVKSKSRLPVASASGRRRRGSLRAAVMSAVYMVAGVAVFGYLATLVYANLFWLEAQSSAITAPVETLVSLGDGFVSWSSYKPGDAVKAGDVVLNVYDNVLEREIEEAEIVVRERENKLAYLLKRQEAEKGRLEALAGVSGQKNVQIGAEINGLEAKLKSARHELKLLPGVAAGAIAQVRQRIVGLKQAIEQKQLELAGRASLAEQNGGRFEVVGQNVVGDLDNLSAQIDLAEADIAIANRRHQSFLNQRDRLAIRAPFDGVLRKLPRADNSTVKKGDVAAVIEQTALRGVTAYLRQDQVLRVRLGASAVVYVPATRQSFKATVSTIDPARGNSIEQARNASSQGGTQRPDEGLAAVRLELAGGDQLQDLATYHDGLPVVTMIGLGHPSIGGVLPAIAGRLGLPTAGTLAASAVAEGATARAEAANERRSRPERASPGGGVADRAATDMPGADRAGADRVSTDRTSADRAGPVYWSLDKLIDNARAAWRRVSTGTTSGTGG